MLLISVKKHTYLTYPTAGMPYCWLLLCFLDFSNFCKNIIRADVAFCLSEPWRWNLKKTEITFEVIINPLKPSDHYMYSPVVTICTAQWSLYVPPFWHSAILRSAHTVYLCVLCGSQNKQPLFPYTTLTDWFCNWDGECLLRGTRWAFKVHYIVSL